MLNSYALNWGKPKPICSFHYQWATLFPLFISNTPPYFWVLWCCTKPAEHLGPYVPETYTTFNHEENACTIVANLSTILFFKFSWKCINFSNSLLKNKFYINQIQIAKKGILISHPYFYCKTKLCLKNPKILTLTLQNGSNMINDQNFTFCDIREWIPTTF